QSLQLLSDGECQFIRRFGSLRNDLVHRIHNVRFRFLDHFAAMPSSQLTKFATEVAAFASTERGKKNYESQVEARPRIILGLGTFVIVGRCLQQSAAAQAERQRIRAALDRLRELEGNGLES